MNAAHAERTRVGATDTDTLDDLGVFALAARQVSVPADGPLVEEVGSIFSLSGFERSRQPTTVGAVDLSAIAVPTRLSSVPIKFPRTSYRVPAQLACVAEALELAAAFEHAVNADVDAYYAYVTVHASEVREGEAQRGSAIHSDGIQGPRIQPKAPVERGYLAVDRFPPKFFCQPFAMAGVDCDRHLLDPVFAGQADSARAVTPLVNTLVAFDSYSVHQAVPATTPGARRFVRVAYSTRQYDRLGNTVNPAFASEYVSHGWQFAPRPLPDLGPPPLH